MFPRYLALSVLVFLVGCGPSAREVQLKKLAEADSSYNLASEKLFKMNSELTLMKSELTAAQVFVENAERAGNPDRLQQAQKGLSELQAKSAEPISALEKKIAAQQLEVDAAQKLVAELNKSTENSSGSNSYGSSSY